MSGKFTIVLLLVSLNIQVQAQSDSSSSLAELPELGSSMLNDTQNSQRYIQIAEKSVDSLSLDNIKSEVVNSITDQGNTIVTSFLSQFFKTVELEMDFTNNENPTSSLILIMPLSNPENTKDTFFMQDSVFYNDNRTTVNFGLGYRRLAMNDTLLLGGNIFYDHEFPYDHARVGVGIEVMTTAGQIYANHYQSLTNWKNGKDGFQERGLNGQDIEIGFPLPYMNGTNVFAKAFSWDSEIASVDDIKGSTFSIEAAIPTVNGLVVELGQTNYSDSDLKDASFLRISYDFLDGENTKKRSSPLFSKHAYKLATMENYRYKKVRRENRIYKQMKAVGNLTVSGY